MNKKSIIIILISIAFASTLLVALLVRVQGLEAAITKHEGELREQRKNIINLDHVLFCALEPDDERCKN